MSFLKKRVIKEKKQGLKDIENKKAIRPKPEKEKKQGRNYPKKSYRLLFQRLFWLGFFALLGFGIYGVLKTHKFEVRVDQISNETKRQREKLESLPIEKEEKKEIKVNEDGMRLYACDFVTDFYTWDFEDKESERFERLQGYLSDEIEDLNYDITNLSTASRVLSADVQSMETLEQDQEDEYVRFDITVKVVYQLLEQKKKSGKINENVISTETNYLKVPVLSDGLCFCICDVPYLVKSPEKLVIKEQETNENQEEIVEYITEDKTVKEINSFLETFIKFSTTATAEELNYYAVEEIEGLQGLYAYVMIDNLQIRQEEKGYLCITTARLQDLSTKAEVLLEMNIKLNKSGDRFMVESIRY